MAGIVVCGATLFADTPVIRGVYGNEVDTAALWAQRIYALGWLLSGAISWAACIVLAAMSEESRETHHTVEQGALRQHMAEVEAARHRAG